jgi:hypothetical protein
MQPDIITFDRSRGELAAMTYLASLKRRGKVRRSKSFLRPGTGFVCLPLRLKPELPAPNVRSIGGL